MPANLPTTPWRMEPVKHGRNMMVFPQRGVSICRVFNGVDWDTKAAAALIVAAPDLLRELKKLRLRAYDMGWNVEGADAAIAKAEAA